MVRSDRGEGVDWVTSQGTWYIVEPFLPKKLNKKGEWVYTVQRDNLVEYIRDICDEELNCRREDLKIFVGGRAEFYYEGKWTIVSWDKIEELSGKGTDGIVIEKEGMSGIFANGPVDKHGMAIADTRGFFVDYVNDVSEQSISQNGNLVLIRDLDISGKVIELKARKLGILCIGVNDEMLTWLGLTRDDVNTPRASIAKDHWTYLKKAASWNPHDQELRKDIEFLKDWRIEIDKVYVTVGRKKLFEYVKHKLAEFPRDANRAASPPKTQTPSILLDIMLEMKRIGKNDGLDECIRIYQEQKSYAGIIDDVQTLRVENGEKVRLAIESNKNIKKACEMLVPILKMLKKVKVKDKYPKISI